MSPAPTPFRRWITSGVPLWLCVSIAIALQLGIAAAYAPAALKKVLLFSIGLGLLAGFLFHLLASVFDVRIGRGLLVGSALLIVGMHIATLVTNHQRWRGESDEVRAMRAVLSVQDSAGDDVDELLRHRLSLAGYLEFYLPARVSALGIEKYSVALIFWIVEVLSSAAAGVWLMRFRSRSGAATASQALPRENGE